MSFTITPKVWNGKHYRIPKPPPDGMITYAEAAKVFGYSVSRIQHLASEGRVEGGGGYVRVSSMARWAEGRTDKLKPTQAAA